MRDRGGFLGNEAEKKIQKATKVLKMVKVDMGGIWVTWLYTVVGYNL